MSHWNHRVVKKFCPEMGKHFFEIHEAHYNDDGALCAYTQEGVAPYGETVDELRKVLRWMLKSLDKPVLVDGEVVFARMSGDDDDDDD